LKGLILCRIRVGSNEIYVNPQKVLKKQWYSPFKV